MVKAKSITQRRRLWPMPVEAIIDHPGLMLEKSFVFGIVMRLLLHYWNTDCAPLTTETKDLESIARAGEHAFEQHAARFMPIVYDILPTLDHYYAVRVNRLNHVRNLSQLGVGVRRANKLERLRVQHAATREADAAHPPRTRLVRKGDPPPVTPPVAQSGERKRRTG